jgi:hypothetical protein
MPTEHGRRREAMSDKSWYDADALGADLTNRNHHLRAASEEVERRMRKRYPGAVAILVLLEESWRQNRSVIGKRGAQRTRKVGERPACERKSAGNWA